MDVEPRPAGLTTKAKIFIDNFFVDVSVDKNGKNSKTLLTETKNAHAFRSTKDLPEIQQRLGYPPDPIEQGIGDEEQKKPCTSIVSVELECGYTYPKGIFNRAFEKSLTHKKHVYVTVNMDFEDELMFFL